MSVLFRIACVKFTIQSRSSEAITSLALVSQLSITLLLGGCPDFSVINLGISFFLNDFAVLVSNCSKWPPPLHFLSRSAFEFCRALASRLPLTSSRSMPRLFPRAALARVDMPPSAPSPLPVSSTSISSSSPSPSTSC